MGRIKLTMPSGFSFETRIPVRITDLNYGGHVGNDTILSIIHEARMQFLLQAGYTELNFAGAGLIMSDVAIEFKQELFYGDEVIARVMATEIGRVGFDLYYQLLKTVSGETKVIANARTGMVCYDYTNKKVTGIPTEAKEKIAAI
ncbi:thioesterase family protein [Flavihumibacter sp. RY-1]|uniref:Thioesterase family protein n=1 Tax=Flavihumibacter fluminis TaxID=2909236 RepID=A0ABS9BHN8_9BACT|nr:thioesterase family protein [Flavihumibacter fluminis]MCF1714679.1 thioesterase family protein [Flavihumibacter fluminis]